MSQRHEYFEPILDHNTIFGIDLLKHGVFELAERPSLRRTITGSLAAHSKEKSLIKSAIALSNFEKGTKTVHSEGNFKMEVSINGGTPWYP